MRNRPLHTSTVAALALGACIAAGAAVDLAADAVRELREARQPFGAGGCVVLPVNGPVPSPDPDPGVSITACINRACRCTETYAGCIDCITAECDATWDDDEDNLYRWWCVHRSRKGC